MPRPPAVAVTTAVYFLYGKCDLRYRGEEDFELSSLQRAHELLGAGPPSGTVQFTLFIPSTDRLGNSIDQEYWREEALRALGSLFRGATAFPPGRGVWRDDTRAGELLFEDIVLVTSYASPDDVTDEAFVQLRRFLHRLGRDGHQGEVGIVVDGTYHGITEFDPK